MNTLDTVHNVTIRNFIKELTEGRLEDRAAYMEKLYADKDDVRADKFYETAKKLEPAIRNITSNYLLDNYRMELSGEGIFFRWITHVTPSDPTPRSNFSIYMDGETYCVSISRKQYEDAVRTDSIVALTAFLNVYEDYLIEQGLLGY